MNINLMRKSEHRSQGHMQKVIKGLVRYFTLKALF